MNLNKTQRNKMSKNDIRKDKRCYLLKFLTYLELFLNYSSQKSGGRELGKKPSPGGIQRICCEFQRTTICCTRTQTSE